MRRCEIRVTGTVQGVGFRPFVARLAGGLGLSGHVGNDVAGVFIEVQGERVEEFLGRLRSDAPALAVVATVAVREAALRTEEGFRIVASGSGSAAATTAIPADAAVCADCLRELRDPRDRRHGYPFIACTNCGPRYTMTRGLPYDRDNTSMADFPLCPACRIEYTDPTSRRYHAQPIACADCGPQLTMAVPDIVAALHAGQIVAIKGIGGYHLACNARDSAAVARLRARKQRGAKPLAVMVADLGTAQAIAQVPPAAQELLCSPAAPIVLLAAKDQGLLRAVAPGNPGIGVLLPYTPLHHLIFDGGAPPVLVMTSANLADEPICTQEHEAQQRLAGIADVFVHHNRDISTACDDSVLQLVLGAPQPVRRSRGYVPRPLPLPLHSPALVAVGAELKATACLAVGGQAWLTQHVGDIADLHSLQVLRRCIATLSHLQRVDPVLVVSDAHPGYLSRQWAQAFAGELGVAHRTVQHHHAHLAALLAEHLVPPDEPVLGVVFDGTGYGCDGTIWGGEFLLGSYRSVRRVGHLRPVPLPGGDAAIAHPARVAIAHLVAAGIDPDHCAPAQAMSAAQLRLLRQMLATGSHCIPTSSVGRLFDAVASLLNVRHACDYEAQAAIELQALAANASAPPWPAQVHEAAGSVIIDPRDWIAAAVAAHRSGADVAAAARSFHAGLAEAVAHAVARLRQRHDVHCVGLTGGVFSNEVLTAECVDRLQSSGVRVLVHRGVPANDGGLALGQACVAAASLLQR